MDNFKNVKEKLNAIDVVAKYLGEAAKISGENHFWHSFLRQRDNDPSLCVNAETGQITDFGDDTFRNQDIINFVVKYYEIIENKQITNSDALKILVNEFNLDVNLSNSSYTPTSSKKAKLESSTKKLILQATDHKVDKIFTMIDPIAFTAKPASEEMGQIKNRITQNKSAFYTLSDVKNAVSSGHTIIPSGVKSERDWLDELHHCQIFLVDIDNTTKINGEKVSYNVGDTEHVSLEKIIDYCKSINLIPTFIYYTFSHSEQQHRFRLVYVLEKTLDYKDEIKEIYKFLIDTFKDFNIDTAPTSISSMFLGGTEIAYSSDIIYNVAEVTQSIEEIFSSNISICNKLLNNSPYYISNGFLFNVTGTEEKRKFTPISNFIVWVDEKINYKNGNDTDVKYKVNALSLDRPDLVLPALYIDKEQYAKFNFTLGSAWDKHCRICANRSNTDRLRETTQILSQNTMLEKDVYTHTGFTEIDGKKVYLYHGGFIGDSEKEIEVDLSGDKLERFHFTDKEFDIQDALKTSLSFLDVANLEVTIPIIATTYLAPLFSSLSKNNIHADYILFLIGRSGSRKSSLAAVALSHFGEFDRDHFPSTFRDTLNSIEKKAFLLNDSLNIIDDFNPEINGTKKLDIIEKTAAMYGDRTGRTRMSQDCQSLKAPYTARGLCLETGEMKPDLAQSRIARMLFVDMKPNSVNLAKLSELQENSENLAFAMKKYIKWFIDNEEEIIQYAKNLIKELNKNIPSTTIHGRTWEISNVLTLGFRLFTQFMKEHNIIDINKKQELDYKCDDVLKTLVEDQTQEIQDLTPCEMFYYAFNQLLTTKQIYVTDLQKNTLLIPSSFTVTDVGYYDSSTNLYYLYPDVVYSEVCKFYSSQNIKFPLSQKSLWKYLCDEKYLIRNDTKRYKIQKRLNNKSFTCVKIKNKEIVIDEDEENIFNTLKATTNKPKKESILDCKKQNS